MDVVPPLRDLLEEVAEEIARIAQLRGLEVTADRLDALRGAVAPLGLMAMGNPDPVLYLCSLEPGGGKTLAVTSFARVLARRTDLRDVGMVVCLSSKDAIREFVAALDLPSSLGVLTGDPLVNKLAGIRPIAAQILATTQQFLGAMAQSSQPFSKMEAYWFKGYPRQVRGWDEGHLPRQPVTLDHYAIASLPRLFWRASREWSSAGR